MDKKILEIRDYMAQSLPLKGMPLATLTELAEAVEEISVEQGETIMRNGKTNDHVFLIRHGAVELIRDDGVLHGRFTADD